ncbi:MAG: MBL fold metallo-hydrolase [Pseudomonadota bacterium]
MIETLTIRQIPVGPMMNFSYLVGDPKSGKAVIIDPCWEAEKLIARAMSDALNISFLLATHAHFDHINALEPLCEQLKIPVYVHESEADELPEGIRVEKTKEGTIIPLGDHEFKCLHTPGHTPGSQCFLIDGNLFTGDTLFVESCGRVDLPGGDESVMRASLKRLSELPSSTIVYPGHDYGSKPSSTIDYEKKNNPFMGG